MTHEVAPEAMTDDELVRMYGDPYFHDRVTGETHVSWTRAGVRGTPLGGVLPPNLFDALPGLAIVRANLERQIAAGGDCGEAASEYLSNLHSVGYPTQEAAIIDLRAAMAALNQSTDGSDPTAVLTSTTPPPSLPRRVGTTVIDLNARDIMAGQCMAALLAHPNLFDLRSADTPDKAADVAVRCAEALLLRLDRPAFEHDES